MSCRRSVHFSLQCLTVGLNRTLFSYHRYPQSAESKKLPLLHDSYLRLSSYVDGVVKILTGLR